MSAPALRLRGLRKRFGERVALDGIDLDLTGAQLVGLVGPDGAGKTTLLRALAGLLEVDAQDATVLGVDLRGDVRPLKERIGYVPQVFSLQRELSVRENLAFTARLHRIPAGEFERRSGELLERTALAPFAARPAGALSGGMKQKLAVANALLPEPDLLLLDEPTAGVDVVARDEILALLGARRRQALIVMSTSYLEETESAERLVYLDGGRVVAEGTPADLRARVEREVYRAWGDDPAAITRAAERLPYVASVRPSGRFARIEILRRRTPGAERVLRDLTSLAGARLAEEVPLDMEATLLALAQADGTRR